MLTIRLSRKGKKNQPFFRVVVIDKRRSTKGGRSVEDLGYVNPLTKKISLNKERIQYWLKTGAQPSDTIHNLLVKEKVIDAKKIHVSKLSKKKQAEILARNNVAALGGDKENAAKVQAAASSADEASLAPEGAGSNPEEVAKEESKPTEEVAGEEVKA
ncbi:MAG: 30S ribosomal protein S16 [Patescibacteria group bacterium]